MLENFEIITQNKHSPDHEVITLFWTLVNNEPDKTTCALVIINKHRNNLIAKIEKTIEAAGQKNAVSVVKMFPDFVKYLAESIDSELIDVDREDFIIKLNQDKESVIEEIVKSQPEQLSCYLEHNPEYHPTDSTESTARQVVAYLTNVLIKDELEN